MLNSFEVNSSVRFHNFKKLVLRNDDKTRQCARSDEGEDALPGLGDGDARRHPGSRVPALLLPVLAVEMVISGLLGPWCPRAAPRCWWEQQQAAGAALPLPCSRLG